MYTHIYLFHFNFFDCYVLQGKLETQQLQGMAFSLVVMSGSQPWP